MNDNIENKKTDNYIVNRECKICKKITPQVYVVDFYYCTECKNYEKIAED